MCVCVCVCVIGHKCHKINIYANSVALNQKFTLMGLRQHYEKEQSVFLKNERKRKAKPLLKVLVVCVLFLTRAVVVVDLYFVFRQHVLYIIVFCLVHVYIENVSHM